MAWLLHTLLLKVLLYLMGIPAAVPFLELVAYAGYPFVHICLAAIGGAAFGELGRRSIEKLLWNAHDYSSCTDLLFLHAMNLGP